MEIKREELEQYLINKNSEMGEIATNRIFSIKIKKNLEITILSVIDSDFIGSLIQAILDYIIDKEIVYSEIIIKFV